MVKLLEQLYKAAETDKQRASIDNVCKAFYNAPFSVVIYFSDFDFDEIDGKVSSRIYKRYCEWCNTNAYMPESKNTVGRYIVKTYQMNTIQEYVNGDRESVYRWIGYND